MVFDELYINCCDWPIKNNIIHYSINVRSINLFVNDIMMYIAKIIYRSHCSPIVFRKKTCVGFGTKKNEKMQKNDQKKQSKTQK